MTEAGAEQLDMTLSLGQLLQKAREQQGLTQGQVAEHLRLTKDMINKIETDHFADQDYSVFVRGYIRSYAKYIQVSQEEVEAFFESLTAVEQQPKPSQQAPLMLEQTSPRRRKSIKWISLGIVAVLIILALVWVFWQRSNTAAPVTPTPMTNSNLVNGDHSPTGNTHNQSLSEQFAKKGAPASTAAKK